MEKTISILIASTTFSLSESAYTRLSEYLAGLKAHFAHDEDGTEIVRDIESRIAEKLLERKLHVVTEADIDAVTKDMGTAAELDGTEIQAEATKAPERKFYRDQDRAIIAGVASGVAAYFGIDPLITRLIFFLSIFFGGTGIFVYLVLWLLIPTATSASQKLEMQGTPVTLEGISRIVKDRANETQDRGILKRILYFPFEVIGALIRFFTQTVFPVVGKLLGLILALVSFFAIIAATIGAGAALFNWNTEYMQFPLRNAFSPELLFSALASAYVIVAIPLILIHALGHKLLHSRTILPSIVGFGMVGLWALALISGGITSTRIASEYQAFIATDPAYAASTKRETLQPFTTLNASYQNITIAQAEEYAIEINGRKRDLDSVSTRIDGETLHIERARYTDSCFIFCDSRSPSVTIYVPSLEAINLTGSSIDLESLSAETLTIDARYSHIDGSLATGRLNVRVHGSSIELSGSADEAELTLEYSSFHGRKFKITNATTTTRGSSANLYVSGTLSRTLDETSSVEIMRN